jgi:hypothetical protein
MNIKNKETLDELQELKDVLWKQIQEGNRDLKILKLYQDTAFKLVRFHAIYDKHESQEESHCILDDYANNKH